MPIRTHQRRNTQDPDERYLKSIKLDVPTFDGQSEPKDFLEWIRQVDDYFNWYPLSEERRIKFAAMKLTGQASQFWANLEMMRVARQMGLINTWVVMKGKLKEKYCNALNTENPHQTLSRFKARLREDLRNKLLIQGISELERAYAIVQDLDITRSSSTFKNFVQGHKHTSSQYPTRFQTQTSSQKTDTSSGSKERDNKGKGTERNFSKISSTTKCYKCQGYGHVAANCPSPVKIAIVIREPIEELESKTDEFVYHVEEEDFDSSEEFDENDISLSCIRSTPSSQLAVARCALSQPKDKDDWRRTNMFHTFTKIGVKSCKIIVDSGSCINAISSTELVMFAKEICQEFEKGVPIMILITREVAKESNTSLPPEVTPMISEFANVFPEDLPEKLPPMRDIQHAIDLVPRASLTNLPHYRMNPTEHTKLKRQVDELLKKIDLKSGYHQICIRPREEWKTTFKTKDGLYEWMVMPFRLTNAPSTFMRVMTQVQLLGFVVSAEGVSADHEKVKAINDWPEPKNTSDVRSFHGLATFYHRFIKGFSMIMAPITDSLKKGEFEWSREATKAFLEIKERMVNAPVMRLSDFNKIFEVACDASRVGIDGGLSQEGHPVVYFSEKLNDTRLRYTTYDKEFYARELTTRLLMLSADESMSFTLRHKARVDNKAVDALSRRVYVLTKLSTVVVGFEKLKMDYESCPDFSEMYAMLIDGTTREIVGYILQDGFLFLGRRLCIP
ncbi:uncharacterized protein LOC109834065 [Asparagus officinalis]|uniref:uncharacterized protein LOC109834065 n=1 Tax=Asparagus officinalis TaxID=4686 RepID=UPI00098E1634|nr:uncharacterized protein LOC109834065 [Asparagus officinalis]